jgi:hypothetical protein
MQFGKFFKDPELCLKIPFEKNSVSRVHVDEDAPLDM